MGVKLLDQYTYLHFASGIVAYFWGVGLVMWLVIHTVFELFENTEMGMSLINKFRYWPGGKPQSDTWINRGGDTIGALVGWLSAYALDSYGSKKNWYPVHLR